MSLVLLIGAGQLGSRYLQGFVASKRPLQITVVDPSWESLEMAKSRWIDVGGGESWHQVHWLASLPAGLQPVDLALVVTPSRSRANIINSIAKLIDVRYWILEKVLAQSSKELGIIRSALSACEGTWVNTSRRMMTWHQSLRDKFHDRGPLQVSFSGGLWGLACNSIHFIDLVAWWTREQLVSLDTTGLDYQWHESKRAGYFEVTGELVAHFSSGSCLCLRSEIGVEPDSIRVVLADGVIWEIDELGGTACSSNSEQIDGCIEYQSQMSGRLLDGILVRGECDLPSLDESSAMHKIFLDSMLSHWNRSQNRIDDLVPIT